MCVCVCVYMTAVGNYYLFYLLPVGSPAASPVRLCVVRAREMVIVKYYIIVFLPCRRVLSPNNAFHENA